MKRNALLYLQDIVEAANLIEKYISCQIVSGVEEIKYITGEYDIMLKVRVKDMEELNCLLLKNWVCA